MMAIYEFLRSIWGLWLMIVFLGICAWAFWPRNKGRFEEYGAMPLKDDDHDTQER